MIVRLMMAQYVFIAIGLVCYFSAMLVSVLAHKHAKKDWVIGGLQLGGVLMFVTAIAHRWNAVGHGPFISMFEILLSNIFSLGLIFLIAYWRIPIVREASYGAFLIISMLAIWALTTENPVILLPPTYDNNWLWVHVFMGKVFLGLLLVATSLSFHGAWQWLGGLKRNAGVNPQIQIMRVAWYYLTWAFVFHSLMLVAGAVWAQDAWGRYWAWDPLETWAFATWLAMLFALHARISTLLPGSRGYLAIIAIFILAFYTFLGLPFVSQAPHKGAI